MNLRQRYKLKNKKRPIRFVAIYSFFALFLLFYSSFARYTTVAEDTLTAEIAKWNIQVNNVSIENGETLSNVIVLVPNSTTQTTKDNKLAPGQIGCFDIIVNPEGTGVAIEYVISFNTTNLPTGINLTTYEIVEDNLQANVENNIISGEIILNQNREELTAEDTKTIKVNWSWDESDSETIPTGDTSYNISATITIKQRISE